MNRKKIVYGLAILGILAAGYVWFFVYNKAHVNYQESDAVFTGQAEALHNKAIANVAEFTQTFVNQAVEVDGLVSEVGTSSFTLDAGLICTLDTNHVDELPTIGQNVTVKGRVVGVDEDILTEETICTLDQCVIITK